MNKKNIKLSLKNLNLNSFKLERFGIWILNANMNINLLIRLSSKTSKFEKSMILKCILLAWIYVLLLVHFFIFQLILLLHRSFNNCQTHILETMSRYGDIVSYFYVYYYIFAESTIVKLLLFGAADDEFVLRIISRTSSPCYNFLMLS